MMKYSIIVLTLLVNSIVHADDCNKCCDGEECVQLNLKCVNVTSFPVMGKSQPEGWEKGQGRHCGVVRKGEVLTPIECGPGHVAANPNCSS
jgi:hypothetical protein